MSVAATSSVREVKLRLRIPETVADRVSSLRVLAEQTFLRGVLDAFEAAVHERLGPRAIVYVARLPLRFRLGLADLTDAALHQQLGHELADGIVKEAAISKTPEVRGHFERTLEAMPRPSPQASMVVFADEAHLIAVALAERAEGRTRTYYHPASSVAELWQLAAAGGDELLDAVADLLDVYELTSQALEADGVSSEVRRRVQRRAVSRGAGSGPSRVHGVQAPMHRDVDVAAEPGGRTPDVESLPVLHRTLSPDRGATAVAVGDVEQDVPSAEVSGMRPPGLAQSAPGDVTSEAEVPSIFAISTRVGGIFFLLSRIAELEIGEHLWCAGVAEGPAIARALALLAPEELRGDPAFEVIAGSMGEPHEIPAWAEHEVIEKTRAALARWLLGHHRESSLVAERCSELAAVFGMQDVHAQIAAAMAALVCARLEVGWSPDPVRELVLRDAKIIVRGEDIVVELASGVLDVAVRRAGLDFDPGWIPWLSRRVRVVYPQEVW